MFTIFYKALLVFVLLKVLFLWPTFTEVCAFNPFEPGNPFTRLLWLPGYLVKIDGRIFLVLVALVCGVGIARPLVWWYAVLIVWLSATLSRLTFPLINGSDLVLNLFLALGALYVIAGRWLKTGFPWQSVVFLVAQIQVALVYALSGYDKLISTAWRSGDALFSVLHLMYYRGDDPATLPAPALLHLTSWGVIIFELSFPMFIWFVPWRWLLLALGIAFHLAIAVLLHLPDFGVLMMIPYLLFLPARWLKPSAMPIPVSGGN
jgi:hypothetical protein